MLLCCLCAWLRLMFDSFFFFFFFLAHKKTGCRLTLRHSIHTFFMRFHFSFWFPYRHQHTYLTDGRRFVSFFFVVVFFLKETFASSGNFPLQAMHWICVQMWDIQAMHHSCSFTSKSKEVYLHFHHIKIPPVLPLLHTTLHCACLSPPVLSTPQTTVKARETFKNFFFLFFFFNCVSLLAQSGTGWALCVPFFQVYFNPHRRKRRSWSKFKVTSADPYKKFFISVENHKKTFPR